MTLCLRIDRIGVHARKLTHTYCRCTGHQRGTRRLRHRHLRRLRVAHEPIDLALAGTMNRKILSLLLTGLMSVSGWVICFAPKYTIHTVGRALIGVVIGGFWSLSAAVAIRLVPTRSVPKALAIFNGGNALATVVAAPLGSYLAGIIGW
jgi:predicted MFS family arabinose efflux permease